ncbi:unnamed protein product [Neospora caninum Liverpool]|uniref:Uncharacterized protein n=1 Tax=Neospora caninum (strain Liverpool) TaxID=572307 RepID=F0V7E1_NEOCL|nr:uncharacterized protein NCLIV_001225 [Neospora caninum Liverpool]CBZ49632.1 unnamed protein product [Neospora caninum Liverpool]CEL64214.1 TPA: hypothetical protein BN1204_001225_1 [Neospora caninum Liverpool]|eukprot:XP_003879667.1 uncharacterized protein NCLIV_001225 [Neospora caninum Liverpool]
MFYFIRAWRTSQFRKNKNIASLFRSPWRPLDCFLDAQLPWRGANMAGTVCRLASCESIILRCRPMAVYSDRPRYTAVLLDNLDKLISLLLAADILLIFVAPGITVGGHALAETSEEIEELWQTLDRSVIEYNPMICRTFNRLTWGAQEKWFDAARLQNLVKIARHIPRDWRAGLGLLCGGMAFRLALWAGATWRPLVLALVGMKLARWIYSFYQLVFADTGVGEIRKLETARNRPSSGVSERSDEALSWEVAEAMAFGRSHQESRMVNVESGTVHRAEKNVASVHGERRQSCRIPTTVYCFGLEAAFQNKVLKESGHRESLAEERPGKGPTGPQSDRNLTRDLPSVSYLLVGAEHDVRKEDVEDWTVQGTVYVGRQPGTGPLAPLQEEGRQVVLPQQPAGNGTGSGRSDEQEWPARGRRGNTVARTINRGQTAQDYKKEMWHTLLPRHALRVVKNVTGGASCVDGCQHRIGFVVFGVLPVGGGTGD